MRESRRLERLVGDLLDLARMRKAEFSVRSEPIDLRRGRPGGVRRYEAQAREFGVTLEVGGSGGRTGDRRRRPDAADRLEPRRERTPADARRRLGPDRDGAGLDPGRGHRARACSRRSSGHAFERFYLHSRYGRERPVGTGLGLAIVKELAEGMGGTVAAESTPGELTVFTVPAVPAVAVLRRFYVRRTGG